MIHLQDSDQSEFAVCDEIEDPDEQGDGPIKYVPCPTRGSGDRLVDEEAFEAALDAEPDDCCSECAEIHL